MTQIDMRWFLGLHIRVHAIMLQIRVLVPLSKATLITDEVKVWYVCMCVRAHVSYTCTSKCVWVHVCVYMCVCVRVYVCMYVHVMWCTSVNVCVHTWVYVYVCVSVDIMLHNKVLQVGMKLLWSSKSKFIGHSMIAFRMIANKVWVTSHHWQHSHQGFASAVCVSSVWPSLHACMLAIAWHSAI